MNTLLRRILLATDGSEDAVLAARAAEISEGAGSELHLVHVLPQFPRHAYPGITPQLYSYVLDEMYQEARELLDEQMRCIQDSSSLCG